MFGKPKKQEEHRYYLLPGQGRSNRRRRRTHLIVAVLVGIAASGLLAGALWVVNNRR